MPDIWDGVLMQTQTRKIDWVGKTASGVAQHVKNTGGKPFRTDARITASLI
jgi:hypothetical protein